MTDRATVDVLIEVTLRHTGERAGFCVCGKRPELDWLCADLMLLRCHWCGRIYEQWEGLQWREVGAR